ncbi:tetratricopeptide repeat protein [Dyella solisilvae]|nr:tetratricopeptide repeat protein [Dyella solisilvae]
MGFPLMDRWTPVLAVAAVLCGCTGPSAHRHGIDINSQLAIQKHAEDAYKSGRYADAIADYRVLTADMPKNADYWYRMGNALVRMDKPDDAVLAYQAALLRNPEHAGAWHNLAIVRLRQSIAALEQTSNMAKDDARLRESSMVLAKALRDLSVERAATDETGAAPAKAGPL